MASKKDIQADIDFLSDRISTQVRTIALSVIAIAWLFLVGGKDAPILRVPPSHAVLLWAGALSFGALVVDYLQYLMGYLDGRRVLRKGERENVAEFRYDYTSATYRLRAYFYWGKQVLVIAGVVALAFAIGKALVGLEVEQASTVKPAAVRSGGAAATTAADSKQR